MSKKDLLTLAKDFRATDAPGRLKAQDFEKKFAAQISGTVKNNQYVEDEGAMRINFTRMSAEIRGAINLGKVTLPAAFWYTTHPFFVAIVGAAHADRHNFKPYDTTRSSILQCSQKHVM